MIIFSFGVIKLTWIEWDGINKKIGAASLLFLRVRWGLCLKHMGNEHDNSRRIRMIDTTMRA